MRIVIAGATGLVGRALVDRLGNDPSVSKLFIVGRRQPDAVYENAVPLTGAVEDWPSMIEGIEVDIAISALGTTLRDAGSQAGFYAVDHDAVLSVARASRASGARQFLMVSSVGAHGGSRNFYLATKGKAEASVANVGFDRVDIARPGLLRGARQGRLRLGERLGMIVSPVTDILTPAVLSRYRSIDAAVVAAALHRATGAAGSGVFIHHNDEMRSLAVQ